MASKVREIHVHAHRATVHSQAVVSRFVPSWATCGYIALLGERRPRPRPPCPPVTPRGLNASPPSSPRDASQSDTPPSSASFTSL